MISVLKASSAEIIVEAGMNSAMCIVSGLYLIRVGKLGRVSAAHRLLLKYFFARCKFVGIVAAQNREPQYLTNRSVLPGENYYWDDGMCRLDGNFNN